MGGGGGFYFYGCSEACRRARKDAIVIVFSGFDTDINNTSIVTVVHLELNQ